VLEDAPKNVGVSAVEVVEERLVCDSGLGHRGSPGLGKSFQENSAVAFLVYLAGRLQGLTRIYTTGTIRPCGRVVVVAEG
jgi:hypothetical protein